MNLIARCVRTLARITQKTVAIRGSVRLAWLSTTNKNALLDFTTMTQLTEDTRKQVAQAIDAVSTPLTIKDYQGGRADVVVIFDDKWGVRELRTEWLRNHRDAFKIVDYKKSDENKSWMQLKEKQQ